MPTSAATRLILTAAGPSASKIRNAQRAMRSPVEFLYSIYTAYIRLVYDVYDMQVAENGYRKYLALRVPAVHRTGMKERASDGRLPHCLQSAEVHAPALTLGD